MKLATYKDGSRDGQLVVVARDLGAAHYATGIATRLQAALDDWNFIAPQLHDLYATLNAGKARHAFPFEARRCMAPLPRAYQWAVAARAGDGPTPTLRASDDLLGPCDDIVVGDAAVGIDSAAGLAVVTGDAESASSPEVALEGVRLLMIFNGVGVREPDESLATAFGPVAATPDELGDAWQGGRVHLALQSRVNGERIAPDDAAAAASGHFGRLIARLCRTRRLRAGSIVGLEHAIAATLRAGDRTGIELFGRDAQSVCGAIERRVAQQAVDIPPGAAFVRERV